VCAALNTDAVESRMWLNKDRLKGKLRVSQEIGMQADYPAFAQRAKEKISRVG